MKIVELKIDDSMLSGFEAIALVESPAIEQDFIAFNKVNMAEMTYNDYPQGAIDAAKRGIELNKENDMKCATQVGKVRAQQLVNGEKLSLDTIQRMRSFLIRQKGNYELATKRKDYNACGYISYLLWGGEAALPWAEKKLRQSGLEFNFAVYNNEGLLETQYADVSANVIIEDIIKDYIIAELLGLDEEDFMEGVPHYTADGKLYEGLTHKQGDRLMTGATHTDESELLYHEDELMKQFNINVNALPNFINEASSGKKHSFAAELAEKQMLVGPLMTPGKLIPRKDEETGEEYNVFFTAETIEKIAYKMMQDKLLDNVNIEHDNNQKVNDVILVETWIVKDPLHDKSTLYGFLPVVGEWFGIYRVGNGRVWNEYVKTGKVKGFSVEGYFVNNILTNK